MADFRLPISSTSTHKSVNPNSLTFTNTGVGTGTISYDGSDTVSIDLSKIAASTADALATSTTFNVNLAGATATSYNGSQTTVNVSISNQLKVANGGTGQTSYTIGDILYASDTSALSKLGGNTTTTRKFLRSVATTSGTAVAPAWDTVTATDVGLSNVTNTAALNKNTGAKGDIIYWSATNTPAHLTNTSSTTKNFLSITSQVPAWTTLSKSDVGLGNVENIALSTWTGSNKIATVGTITSGTWQGTTIGTSYLPTASTSSAGIVQLSSATNSTSTTLAATASAVKAAYDLANGKTSNTGTVTSITISATSPVAVSATGAITTSGTRTISLSDAYGDTKNPYGTKTANYVLAGPSSGDAAAPAFRALVAADIPALAASKITSGTFDAARIPSLSTDKLTSGTLPVGRGGTGQTSIANIQAGKDGDGNTISSTYLKLSGGTMTGTITTHGLKGTLNVDYGDTLPSSPTEGQIFFQLSDPQYELPTGGTTGQALIKSSNSDRDVTWGSVTVDDRVAKAGDTMTGQLCSANTGGQWILGRDNALIRHTTAIDSSSFSPIFSSKTVLGSWEAGPCHPNEDFLFSYATDTNYNSSTNVTQHNIRFTASGQVYGAVWNDYAEMRHAAENIKPGSCVYEIGDDTMAPTYQRLQKGCKIVSDTFGFNIGKNDTAKTPIAVAGRALVYLLEGREAAKNAIGEFVCSGPNGTVSIMTTEEYLQNPQAVVGTISSVPDYEEWGSGNVKVNGRIWIYVR